jgi:hypothetical protein
LPRLRKARTWGGTYSKFSSWLDFTEIQAAGEKNAAYIYYYTTKPARKPVTYVTDQGNSIGVALGIGLPGCDIDKCYDADTEIFLPESGKVMIELGS